VNLHFSEFSYGYRVTQEYVSLYAAPLKAAPVFPSLWEEGKKGFDVELLRLGIKPNHPGRPLFLQFKLSELITRQRSTQKEVGYYTPPFYRVPLRTRRPNQHQLLRKLEARGNEVYYIAPAFHTTADLNQNYTDTAIVSNSILITPRSLGKLKEGEKHHFSFEKATDKFVWRFSKPKKNRVTTANEVAAKHREQLVETRASTTLLGHDGLSELERVMRELLDEQEPQRSLFKPLWSTGQHFSKLGTIQRLAYLARIGFECSLFLIGTAATPDEIGATY
jgi:hypothetical protein